MQVWPQQESLLTMSDSPVWILSFNSSSPRPAIPDLLLFFLRELFFDLRLLCFELWTLRSAYLTFWDNSTVPNCTFELFIDCCGFSSWMVAGTIAVLAASAARM